MVIESAPTVPGQGHADGRALLARMYETYVGGPMPELLYTSRGKPYFRNSPVHFSISHTSSRVFCAFHNRPVGLDAEREDRQVDLRLADKILSPSEKVFYDRAQDRRLTLLKLWVLKEAWAKATGRGLEGYPRHTDFSPEDPRLQFRDGHILAVLEG